ncbi:MAG: hypothetical protein N2255_01495, partial [Kiritimatiellae bacterium]|nr:hypothetical protein [Kiritimatiellia bacterium]
LILLMGRFKGDDGKEANVAFDPEARKYYAVDLDFEGGRPRELSWSAALHYDRKLGIALLHDGFSGVWALKFDRKTARMIEIGE